MKEGRPQLLQLGAGDQAAGVEHLVCHEAAESVLKGHRRSHPRREAEGYEVCAVKDFRARARSRRTRDQEAALPLWRGPPSLRRWALESSRQSAAPPSPTIRSAAS